MNKVKKVKISLEYDSNDDYYFLFRIENKPDNVFPINGVDNEENYMFSKGNWIFILFAGYSGQDLKFLYELMEVVKEYPNLNFALKPYMDDDKMQEFTNQNIQNKVPPILLHKNDIKTTLICNRLNSIEKVKEFLNKL